MEYTLSISEAVTLLGTTRSTLYKWLRTGRVPAKKLGGQWRFSRDELVSFRDGQGCGDRLRQELSALRRFFQERDPRARGKPMTKVAGAKREGSPAEAGSVAEAMVWDAHARGASDIHLQPRSDGVHVLYRMKGGLEPVRVIAADAAGALARAWESLCARLGAKGPGRFFLDRPVEQGTATIQVGYEAVDTLQGRRLTLRISGKDLTLRMERIFEDAGDRKTFERWIARPHGIILFSGAVGSGKTTTLYSCLRHLAQDRRKAVFSLERPIEVQLDGIDQVEAAGTDEASLEEAFLRIMRSDPDVLAVGVDSPAAAKLALQAARTGHLVLMQVHATSGEEALRKLEHAVGEPVRDSLIGVSWQRLEPRPGGGRRAAYALSE